MSTMDQLVENEDIQPLRSTTLHGMDWINAQEQIRRQESFIRDVGAPTKPFRVYGAPFVPNREKEKKEKDDYELRKLQWLRMNI